MIRGVCFVFVSLFTSAASADMAEILDCRRVSNPDNRLACYDRVADGAQPATPPADGGQWRRSVEVSPIDDSKRVVLVLDADDTIPARFGGNVRPSLVLRCSENTTAAYVNWNTYLGIQDTTVTYRVDSKGAQRKRMSVSTDHEAAGFFRGASSIPFIRQLLGGEALYMQITPYGAAPVSTTFTLAGLDNLIGELRSACNW